MEYWPESPQWAGVAKNLEEYLSEQNKTAKYRREKEKYRCKRPHVNELPQRGNRKVPDDVFHTAQQWPPPQQAGWAGLRPLPRQQDWQQDRVPGYAPNRPVPQNRNHIPRYPNEDLEDDDVDEDDQAQQYYSARNFPSSNRRRDAFRSSGRDRPVQDDTRVVYDSDERLQRLHRPRRAGQRYDAADAFTRPRPLKSRHKPYERPYDSDNEVRYGRNPYRGQQPSDNFEDRQESQDRRMEDEGGEGGGVTDGA
ncbi:hypothetical protein MMC17_002104 [Xylographa soralifera]|nr:hypothetical protein [Xylographa soralifera]